LRELDKIETGLQSQGGPEQVDRRTLRGKLSDEDEARFKELARQGLTHQQIADQLGIGKANVTRRMHNLIDSGQLSKDEIRRQIGGPLPQPFERQEELERLLKSGMTHQAISSQMKIGAQTFYQALKKMREGSEAVPQREKAVGLGFGVPGKKGLVPSMPEFKFKDKAPDKIDKEYMEELEKYLKDLQSYYDAISGGKYV
jgi:transposase